MAKVLIVDDEKSIRRTLSEFVTEDGHEALTAADAKEALRLLRESSVDVVVTDIILPNVTGVALLEKIQQASPDVQVVMITGEPTVDTAAAAVRAGAFDYLAKPIARDEIKAVVASAVRVKALADERARLAEENRQYQENLEAEVERKTKELRESEEKYRTVIENADEAVFIAQGGSLPFANPKTCEITGYTSDQLQTLPFAEVIHPDDRAMVLERFQRRLRGGDAPSRYRFRVVTAEGATRWIEIRPVVVEWEGQPASLNFASDVTDGIAAEEALRAGERKWRELFENLRDGWVSTDMEGRFSECNRAYEELLGYSLEELMQLTYQQLTPETWWAFEQDLVEKLIVGRGYSGVYRKEYIRKDGTVFPVELSSYLVRDEDGTPIGMWGLARDISGQVAAEKAREESEIHYRTLFENSPISLWLEDYSEVKRFLEERRHAMNGDPSRYLREHPDAVKECIRLIRVVDVNDASLTLHGASSKEQLLGSLDRILTPRSRREFAGQLAALMEGSTTFEEVTVDQTVDAVEKHIALRWVVAPGYEDSLERVLVSKYDITATVEAEEALQAALSGTIEAIGLTTETRDPYTAGHQRRVTELAVAIAEELGLSETSIEGTRAAGLMHDIGKMAIPAEILSKPSALTEMEMALIRSHPQVACDILKGVSFPWPLAEIVLQHHERIDGSGYPQGIRGEEILTEARILAVADTVEAMASHRPYRAALGIDVALEEIEEYKGIRYDVHAADACLKLFREGRFAFGEVNSRAAGA